eukprot:COSAG01_NODE_31538_length_595_cov_36.231855_2_plen_115_part_01
MGPIPRWQRPAHDVGAVPALGQGRGQCRRAEGAGRAPGVGLHGVVLGLPGREAFPPSIFLDKNRRDIGKISVKIDRAQDGNARITWNASISSAAACVQQGDDRTLSTKAHTGGTR